MGRNHKLTNDQISAIRLEFRESSEQGVALGSAIKTMRKISGMNQLEFARLLKVAPRLLMDIERGHANPTIETLNKIGKPFGLKTGFVRVER